MFLYFQPAHIPHTTAFTCQRFHLVQDALFCQSILNSGSVQLLHTSIPGWGTRHDHSSSIIPAGVQPSGEQRAPLTKVLCTIGPASDSAEVLKELLESGVQVRCLPSPVPQDCPCSRPHTTPLLISPLPISASISLAEQLCNIATAAICIVSVLHQPAKQTDRRATGRA